MRKTLTFLAALVVSVSSAAAHADTISGSFAAVGSDSFTSSSVTFGSAEVYGAVTGTFVPYLVAGSAVTLGTVINFPDGTTLPYLVGTNTPPPLLFPAGFVPLFSVTGTYMGNTETFTFDMTQYTAGYIVNNMNPTSGCTAGSTCLNVTGVGYFSETGPLTGVSGPATFNISSQYVPTQGTTTTFSASTGTIPNASTPEPSSLVLLGTGFLSVVGLYRRKFNV